MGFLVFLQDILSAPALLIGVFAMIGLIAQKPHFTNVIAGTLIGNPCYGWTGHGCCNHRRVFASGHRAIWDAKITGGNDLAICHFGTFGYILSALTGKMVGKNSKSIEKMKFPKELMFFRDTSVAMSITMLVIFLAVTLSLAATKGADYIHAEITEEQNFPVFSIIQVITFTAGIYVILAGVRLLLGEINPAFKSFADKIAPNTIPALDCPAVFPFAPNTVIVGFIASFVGGIVGLVVCGIASWTLILPGVIPRFFYRGHSRFFCNATGRRKRVAKLAAFYRKTATSSLKKRLYNLFSL